MSTLVYRPARMLLGMVGGALAGAIFSKVWKVVARQDETPKATDAQRGWGEILVSAALQGAIIAAVKAAADRGAAEGTHKLTGIWPGENGKRRKRS